ncbi:MAG: hypothetical protein HWE16_06865, partial [Gammaproteobacteria bacterium]|nr:hypothetical protein [Gammaproteobacteria bacterium]
QHQAFAWNGNFDQSKGSIEFDGSDSYPDQSMSWEASKTHIKIGDYKFISDHYLMLELQEHQAASLIPECSDSNLPLTLLPYHCKLKKHD